MKTKNMMNSLPVKSDLFAVKTLTIHSVRTLTGNLRRRYNWSSLKTPISRYSKGMKVMPIVPCLTGNNMMEASN